MTIGTALFFLIVYFADGHTDVSITLEQDMNACHDSNKVAAQTLRVLNDRVPVDSPKRVRQWTGICVDISEYKRKLLLRSHPHD